MAFGRYKVILSGSIIEVYEYEKYVKFGGDKKKKSKNDIENWEVDDEVLQAREKQKESELSGEKKTKEEMRLYSRTRTRNNIRRQVLANFSNHSKFITLTFADNDDIDINNVEYTNREFKKFIQRLRRKYDTDKKQFKYLAVIEFQDKNDRGAVHYHMMSDLPYIPNAELAKMWGLGFVRINDIKQCDNVGAYISAYINKDINDSRLDGKKVYLASKNVLKPKEIRGVQALKYITNLDLENKKTVFESSYTSEYCGEIKYREYNLIRTINETNKNKKSS